MFILLIYMSPAVRWSLFYVRRVDWFILSKTTLFASPGVRTRVPRHASPALHQPSQRVNPLAQSVERRTDMPEDPDSNPRRSKKCLCYICARISVYFVYLMYVKFYSYVYINFIALAHKPLNKPSYMQVTWNPLRTHIIITGFHVHIKRYFSLPNMKYIHVYICWSNTI